MVNYYCNVQSVTIEISCVSNLMLPLLYLPGNQDPRPEIDIVDGQTFPSDIFYIYLTYKTEELSSSLLNYSFDKTQAL